MYIIPDAGAAYEMCKSYCPDCDVPLPYQPEDFESRNYALTGWDGQSKPLLVSEEEMTNITAEIVGSHTLTFIKTIKFLKMFFKSFLFSPALDPIEFFISYFYQF